MFSAIVNFVVTHPTLILGNVFGLVATIFAVLSYQAGTPKKTLLLNSGTIISVMISYTFLGAWAGFSTNGICLLRNITYALTGKVALFRTKAWPYVAALVLGGVGFLSWQGPISLLVILALMANSVFIGLGDNQKLRWSILITSTMMVIYNLYFMAYLAAIMEMFSIVSAAVGLIRYRKTAKPLE